MAPTAAAARPAGRGSLTRWPAAIRGRVGSASRGALTGAERDPRAQSDDPEHNQQYAGHHHCLTATEHSARGDSHCAQSSRDQQQAPRARRGPSYAAADAKR